MNLLQRNNQDGVQFVHLTMWDYCAVPVLIEMLKADENAVRTKAAFSLGRIGDRRAVPALLEARKDADNDMRDAIAYVLRSIESKSSIDP